MTNGDYIRSLMNQDLVDIFMDAGHDYPVYCNPISAEISCDFDCRKCCLEWLNEEKN